MWALLPLPLLGRTYSRLTGKMLSNPRQILGGNGARTLLAVTGTGHKGSHGEADYRVTDTTRSDAIRRTSFQRRFYCSLKHANSCVW